MYRGIHLVHLKIIVIIVTEYRIEIEYNCVSVWLWSKVVRVVRSSVELVVFCAGRITVFRVKVEIAHDRFSG